MEEGDESGKIEDGGGDRAGDTFGQSVAGGVIEEEDEDDTPTVIIDDDRDGISVALNTGDVKPTDDEEVATSDALSTGIGFETVRD